jgi:hypothetical protein
MPQHPVPVSSTSPFPSGTLSFQMPQLSAGTREALGQTLSQFIEVNQGLPAQYDRLLDVANALYEMPR